MLWIAGYVASQQSVLPVRDWSYYQNLICLESMPGTGKVKFAADQKEKTCPNRHLLLRYISIDVWSS